MNTRERNKSDKRQRILRAAGELFLEKGFEATTTREIAVRSGVASGTVFLYARDKSELLSQVGGEALVNAIRRGFAAADPTLPLIEQMVVVYRHFFELYAPVPELARLFMQQMLTMSDLQAPWLLAMQVEFLSLLQPRFDAAMAAGELRPGVTCIAFANCLFGQYITLLFEWLSRPTPCPTQAADELRPLFRMVFEGIAAR
jgi:TetR/AcrR family transcriptional regulator, cholesterol catabolism regulator